MHIGWKIAARLGLTGVLLASGFAWEAPPVLLSAIFIAGSVVPLVNGELKNRERELKRGGREAELDEVIEGLEDRIGRLQEVYDREISELHDRLDFSERLLSKHNDFEQSPKQNVIGIKTPI